MEKKKAGNCRQNFLYFLISILSLILIAISLLLIVEMRKKSQRVEIECIVNYLKSQDISEESFNSVSEFLGDYDSCELDIDLKIKSMMLKMKEAINEKTNHRAFTICIEKKLNDKNYTNKILIKQVVGYSKISLKFWTFFKRNQRFKELVDDLIEMENSAFDYCTNGDSSKHPNNSDFDEEYGDGSGSINIDDDDEIGRNVRSVPRNTYNDDDLFFEYVNKF